VCDAKGVLDAALLDLELLERAAPALTGLPQIRTLLKTRRASSPTVDLQNSPLGDCHSQPS